MERTKKKLIEVAIPLDAINTASEKEKQPFTPNHPRSLHVWWARRPLVACRALMFASVVDDPSSRPDLYPSEEAQELERTRLFKIIEQLTKWENSNNEEVLAMARAEIKKYSDGVGPLVLDPFSGGGSIPIEAIRLGLNAEAVDINPVAVLITKAMIDVPSRFSGRGRVSPAMGRDAGDKKNSAKRKQPNSATKGMSDDVIHYGGILRKLAFEKIGDKFPPVAVSVGSRAAMENAIAWIWARTVKCPNPACECETPLVRSFVLCAKKGKEAWIQPTVIRKKGKPPIVEFGIRMAAGGGSAPPSTKVGRGAKFKCIACNQPIVESCLKSDDGRSRTVIRLLAIVTEAEKGKRYSAPSPEQEKVAQAITKVAAPDAELANDPRNIWCKKYGLTHFRDLFTERQLLALTTFGEMLPKIHALVLADAEAKGFKKDGVSLESGGEGAIAYADAIVMYLALAVSKWTDLSNVICGWNKTNQNITHLFTRHAIPMAWDFAELNPFGSMGSVESYIEKCADVILHLPVSARGTANQGDAVRLTKSSGRPLLVVTDPPYYDNINYADLSDFFYVWLRRFLSAYFPKLLATVLTPKGEELIACPYRHNDSKEQAKEFFENGMSAFFRKLHEIADDDYPICLYYAFKQTEDAAGDDEDTENSDDAQASTGWETMLTGLVEAGLQIIGTWPVRTERVERSIGQGTNALASSMVLVCRKRSKAAESISKRDFQRLLLSEMSSAIPRLLKAKIAPVDLAQAAIGPGMEVFSRFKGVVEASGRKMSVRDALVEINRVLDAYLSDHDSSFDHDTRWAVVWYEQHGYEEGKFGDAEGLARAKNTSIEGLKSSGILDAKGGKVHLLSRSELDPEWNPQTDNRLSVWEATQHLVKALEEKGEQAVSLLMRKLGPVSEEARSLAYRLFTIAERKGWSTEARAYNALIVAWMDVSHNAA